MTVARSTKRNVIIAIIVVVVLIAGIALWAFAPWKLFTNKTVDEALPSSSPSASPSGNSSSVSPPSGPTVVAVGNFRSYEHTTTGVAKVIDVTNGSDVLRLENFKTSDGPDVRVWLSVKPANAAEGADKANYVDLGALKGNIGNQNYPIPTGTSLKDFRSVIIWCRRFHVPFGAAELQPQEVHILNGQSQ